MYQDDPALHRALAHPLRHRVLIALRGEPATISQLARRLSVHKGSIAHHLGVLVGAGLVHPAEHRRVRGGTEQYYRLPADPIRLPEGDPEATAALLGAVASELTADPSSLLHLRHVRLTAAQADAVRHALDELVEQAPQADPTEPTYGLLVGMYRRR